jgi:mono/diheme cytochrome c family protein
VLRSKICTIAAATLTASLLAAPAWAQRAGAEYTTLQAEVGARVYEERCAGCHLADLEGSFEARRRELAEAQAGLLEISGGLPQAKLDAALAALRR